MSGTTLCNVEFIQQVAIASVEARIISDKNLYQPKAITVLSHAPILFDILTLLHRHRAIYMIHNIIFFENW